jgi:hypothetical protein
VFALWLHLAAAPEESAAWPRSQALRIVPQFALEHTAAACTWPGPEAIAAGLLQWN